MAIDNHLLGLREVAQELKMDKPEIFKDDAYLISNQFILSTSQVTWDTTTSTLSIYRLPQNRSRNTFFYSGRAKDVVSPPLRFLPPSTCSAAMGQYFPMATAPVTTPSQTTFSSQSPASARARRQTRQNSSSVWCRGWWTWETCAITATPTRPNSERVRRTQTDTHGQNKAAQRRADRPQSLPTLPHILQQSPDEDKAARTPAGSKGWEQLIEASENGGLKCVFRCNNCVMLLWSQRCNWTTVHVRRRDRVPTRVRKMLCESELCICKSIDGI